MNVLSLSGLLLILGEEKGKRTRFKTPQEKMRILLRNLVQEVRLKL